MVPLELRQELVVCYYRNYQYDECLEAGKALALQGEECYNTTLMMAFVYSDRGQSKEALAEYQQIYEPDDTFLNYYIALEYYYEGAYEVAKSYLDKADQDDESVQSLNEYLVTLSKPRGVQIADFIEKNYLYDYDEKSLELMKADNGEMSDEMLERYFYNCIDKNDAFSYLILSKDYEYFQAEKEVNTVEVDVKNPQYTVITINSFNSQTGIAFRECVNALSESQRENLVLNLMDNGGGSTYSGFEILNELLPYCVAFTEIYKNGENDPYYSDEAYVEFGHIYVLINRETASCSELIALGLRTYLDNVTLVGEKTFGKGVGQNVYDNQEKAFAVMVVNHYLNIRENNIHHKGIEPDILLAEPSLDKALELIFEESEQMDDN